MRQAPMSFKDESRLEITPTPLLQAIGVDCIRDQRYLNGIAKPSITIINPARLFYLHHLTPIVDNHFETHHTQPRSHFLWDPLFQ